VTPESVVPDALTAAGSESGPAARHAHVLLATCCVVFALSIDPLLWMMGVDIPTRAFGAGWVDYRTFTTTTSVLLVACMLIGGLLGDYFGRRRVLLLASMLTVVGGLLTMIAPDPTWLVVARSMGSAAAAIALPLTLALVRLSFASRDLVRAMLIYNLVIGVGLLLALIAVPIEAVASWRRSPLRSAA
jgi:DHA2 family methylenomycin A resistance protein-like MFS transporter